MPISPPSHPPSSLRFPLPPLSQLLREQVKACYKDAGVNHLQDCASVVDVYLEAARAATATALLNGGRRG